MHKVWILAFAALALWTLHETQAAGVMPSNAIKPDTAHIFVPVGIYYMHGKYVNTVPFGMEPIDDLHDCMEQLQHVVSNIKLKGNMPEGGDLIGACFPVLAETP